MKNLKILLNSITNGTLNSKIIDLHGQKLSKQNINNLSEVLTNNFSVVSKITKIDLSFADIHELPQDIFKDFDELIRLNLNNNALKRLPNLPDRPYALEYFSAEDNPILEINPKYFCNSISLKTIRLKDTKLEDSILDLSDCLSLESYQRNTPSPRKRHKL